MKPWDKQKDRLEQAKTDRVETMKQIIATGLEIPDARTKTLYFLLYLTGGRMCELVRKYEYSMEKLGFEINDKGKKVYKYNKQRTGNVLPSIRGRDIEMAQGVDRPVVLIHLRNEKHRKVHQKTIPLPIDLEETSIIYAAIKDYINSVGQEDELFPFGYQYGYRLLKPYFNPHWFRHVRATHLITSYGFSESQLRNMMGWSDSRPAGIYVSMDWRDTLRGFK